MRFFGVASLLAAGCVVGRDYPAPIVDLKASADEARARDVVLTRDGQLRLGEAVPATPREVRVAEQHAAPGGGRRRPDGGGIRPERRVRILAEALQQLDVQPSIEQENTLYC